MTFSYGNIVCLLLESVCVSQTVNSLPTRRQRLPIPLLTSIGP